MCTPRPVQDPSPDAERPWRWIIIALIFLGTVAMLAGFATAFATSAPAAIVWMSITLFGFQFWVGNVQTLPSE